MNAETFHQLIRFSNNSSNKIHVEHITRAKQTEQVLSSADRLLHVVAHGVEPGDLQALRGGHQLAHLHVDLHLGRVEIIQQQIQRGSCKVQLVTQRKVALLACRYCSLLMLLLTQKSNRSLKRIENQK